MNIKEQIGKKQSELVKILTECGSKNKEEMMQLLEECGLDSDLASKLLDAFTDMNNKQKIAQNTWERAWDSKSGVDYTTSIEKSQENEIHSKQHFVEVIEKSAILMIVKTIAPNEIDEEILDKLYEVGIQEHEITSPAIRTTFHYYNKSKVEEKQLARTQEAKKEAEGQIEYLKQCLENVRDNYTQIQEDYKNLQNKFKARVASDEKHYQAALSQISTLKGELSEIQDRGVLKTMGSKLAGIFGNKRKELPEPTSEIPDTLYENAAEKLGVEVHGKDAQSKENNEQVVTTVSRTGEDEWQQ